MVGLFVGFGPLILFVVLRQYVENIYVLMFFFLVAAVTTTDYWAKLTGNDFFRLAGMIIFPIIASYVAPFSLAYKLFLFGQLALLLSKPNEREILDASLLRRQYGIIFSLIGAAGVLFGACLGIYNLMNDL